MPRQCRSRMARLLAGSAILAVAATAYTPAKATVDGVTGTTFNLTAKPDFISTADGNQVYMWGYGLESSPGSGTGTLSYPGPTMIVNEGDTVTINLTNTLDEPVSIVFPGQVGVQTQAVAGQSQQGQITVEALPATTVGQTKTYGHATYSFVASHPGTFMYHSGSHQDLQTEDGPGWRHHRAPARIYRVRSSGL